MNILKDIWTDLVEKKLWPVALLLVALLVAVPMTLAKPGDPTAAPVETPTADTGDGGPQLALTRAATTGFARPPRVNDDRLDPFAARGRSKALKDAAESLGDAADDVLGGGGGGGTSPGSSDPKSPDSPKTSTPEPETEPEVETEADDLLSILVTATGTDEPEQINDIRTLSPLVDPEAPFLVYVGKTSTNDATFLVSSDVTVNGDGACSPTPQDCRTLTLGIGRTAEFSFVGEPTKKITVTVLDIETKQVKVGGDDDALPGASDDTSADEAAAQQLKREAGAKALKSVLGDDDVVAELARRKVKIRH